MRLVKNKFITTWPVEGYKNVIYRITKWGIKTMLALYDPGMAVHLLNKLYAQATDKYGARLQGAIWIGVWSPKGKQVITVTKDYSPKDAIRLLRVGIKNLEGYSLRLKGVI